nr:MAG: replication associated protein [Cressdnaviricota sp.]
MSRSRGWCFTLNNPTPDDTVRIIQLQDYVKYLICADEIGKQGTPHFQGYLYFEHAKTLTKVKKWLPRAHLEIARATGDKCFKRADYCRKDGLYYEYGQEPTPGETSWDKVTEAMEDPKSHIQTYTQYHRSYKNIINADFKKPHDKTQLILCNKGNIFNLLSEFPREDIYFSEELDCYENQRILVLFDHSGFAIKRWQAGYIPTVKRGYEIIPINPEIVIVQYETKEELVLFKSLLSKYKVY